MKVGLLPTRSLPLMRRFVCGLSPTEDGRLVYALGSILWCRFERFKVSLQNVKAGWLA